MRTLNIIVGLLVTTLVTTLIAGPRPATRPGRGGERGLSQSTENAILLAGAVAVAGIVITVVTAYVQSKLPR
ncbi:hypothetical protein [Aestuariimicrobium sp. Y1814]|uniref:hypothetical protein n=1 Tax=Aestuariimicrobium sp. Y1814 TaxID=3418742 RepID=UPI003DA71590